MADRNCSIVDPCHECDYCSGYQEWLHRPDYGPECYDCGGSYCDGLCPEAFLNAKQENQEIADHIAQCVKEQCYTCQCL